MEFRAVDSAAKGGANRHLAVVSASRARAVARQLGADLMKRLRREAEKLNLRDRHHPGDGETQRSADDACLSEGRVDHTLGAMLLQQTRGRTEDASQFSNIQS